jgi:hypothetical protein
MRNLERYVGIILKCFLETFLWELKLDVSTVWLPWAVGDLGAIGVEYCCSNTEVSLVLENINNFLSSVSGPNPRIISVIIFGYSPIKNRVAAIRTTRKKAVAFMLLEVWCLLSHTLGASLYIGHIHEGFCVLCDQLSYLRYDNRINTIGSCDLLDTFPRSYELFSTALSRTREDNWNMENMKTFRN